MSVSILHESLEPHDKDSCLNCKKRLELSRSLQHKSQALLREIEFSMHESERNARLVKMMEIQVDLRKDRDRWRARCEAMEKVLYSARSCLTCAFWHDGARYCDRGDLCTDRKLYVLDEHRFATRTGDPDV